MDVSELLQQGRLSECLAKLQEEVRKDPSVAKHRVFLFQLLSILGQWDRAITQLNVAAEIDPINLPMAQMCRGALNSEVLRDEIFSGARSPIVFGDPQPWTGWMIQACLLTGQGKHAEANDLRAKALEQAPAVSGTIDDQPFEWISDADPRTGPILEAVINGRYYWVPLFRIHEIHFEQPADLRDLVWLPCQIKWTNGGESVALIPTRYPGSEQSDDDLIRLARKTDWVDAAEGLQLGLGQRMFATEQGDFPILDTRVIKFDNEVEPQAGEESAEDQGAVSG